MAFSWIGLGAFLALLLVGSRLSDRPTRRRGARPGHGGDVHVQVREGRRDAEILSNPCDHDVSLSSWSRRNHSGN
jgi:hypothetical protein